MTSSLVCTLPFPSSFVSISEEKVLVFFPAEPLNLVLGLLPQDGVMEKAWSLALASQELEFQAYCGCRYMSWSNLFNLPAPFRFSSLVENNNNIFLIVDVRTK